MSINKIRKIAISTGGGDAPGLNAVIRAVVLSSLQRGWECYGIREGYNGLLTPELYPDGGVIRLTRADGGRQDFFVAGGFAEITPERTAVLADEAVPLEELSRAAAEARLAEAEDAYRAAADAEPVARDAALRRVASAQAMVDAATR